MQENIELRYLDHVAILVKDLEVSIKWYERVLGLKKCQLPEWGQFPVFMLSNKCGVALFPLKIDSSDDVSNSNKIRIDHFAFNVNKLNFNIAKKKYDELELKYTIQDHHYFHSIYTKDPDGHTVELTTIVVDENEFYG